MYQLVFTKQTIKDSEKIKKSNLKKNVEHLLAILAKDPYKKPPSYEKLVGGLHGAYSRRINIKHRLVYQVYEKEKTVKIIRMWSHYE